MDDAIDATISLMEAPGNKIKIRSSYNIAGVSFNPKELVTEIKRHIPEFTASYSPDYRQQLAESWPAEIDESIAYNDWGWKSQYDMPFIVNQMLKNI
jgi:nucleoside-diphosphate-sugar epimerase